MCSNCNSLKKLEKELKELKEIYPFLTKNQRIDRLNLIRKKLLLEIVELKTGEKNALKSLKKLTFFMNLFFL
nr:hypothetical protein BACY1_08420 [Tenacibaculum mesophilum]